MSVDPERVRVLFLEAVDLPPDEAAALIDRECIGDTALWMELRSLLDHHLPSELVRDEDTCESLVHTLLEGPPLEEIAPRSGPRDVRYVELAELGQGGCGRVTRAFDRRLHRVVAHKSLHDAHPTMRELLLREARLLAYLDDPGAVQVFDCEDGPEPSYTMRLLEGETLRARMTRAAERGENIPVGEVVRVISRIAETMAGAHAKGVIHLDLKPANVILQSFGKVAIIDWGIARLHDPGPYEAYLRAAGHETASGFAPLEGVAGTPTYMPVEQLTGGTLGPAADVFACGTMLYELLTGELPYQARTAAAMILEKSSNAPAPIEATRHDVPPRLAALCLRMLARDPAARPGGFVEVLGELQSMTDGDAQEEIVSLAPGQVLFREGEITASAYRILDGAISISVRADQGEREIARRVPGDLIGEMAVVSGAPRSATATATEPTRVAVVTPDLIERELERASPLIARMLRVVVDRLRESSRGARGDT